MSLFQIFLLKIKFIYLVLGTAGTAVEAANAFFASAIA